jgi:hypothetical protein
MFSQMGVSMGGAHGRPFPLHLSLSLPGCLARRFLPDVNYVVGINLGQRVGVATCGSPVARLTGIRYDMGWGPHSIQIV